MRWCSYIIAFLFIHCLNWCWNIIAAFFYIYLVLTYNYNNLISVFSHYFSSTLTNSVLLLNMSFAHAPHKEKGVGKGAEMALAWNPGLERRGVACGPAKWDEQNIRSAFIKYKKKINSVIITLGWECKELCSCQNWKPICSYEKSLANTTHQCTLTVLYIIDTGQVETSQP